MQQYILNLIYTELIPKLEYSLHIFRHLKRRSKMISSP